MQEDIIRFVASPRGRWMRIGIGAALLSAGVARRKVGLGLVGMLFAGIAIADVYPPAALFGRSIRGRRLRRELGMPAEAALFKD